MAGPPTLTLQAVRDWSGDTEVRKGRDYANEETISGAVLQEDTLKASVQGTMSRPYRVWARLAKGKVTAADCTCPVGGGGGCKHVAALLLWYVEAPDEFSQVEALDANLQARDKAELIALIKLMIRRDPELEVLLTMTLPGAKRPKPADPKVYRRQAAQVFREAPEYEEWAGDEVARGIADIVAVGEGFESAVDWDGALAVYQGVTDAIDDDHSDVLGSDFQYEDDPTGRLMAGLLRALDQLPADAPKREPVLRSAFDLYRTTHTDLPNADADRDDGLDALLTRVTQAERRTLAGWARQAIPAGNDWSARYLRQQATDLLLRIDKDVLDDEQYLTICRQSGLTDGVIARLLSLGRNAEAVAEVERLREDPKFLHYCDLLVAGGEAAAAEQLVRSQPKWQQDASALRWLLERAKARRDADEVLALTEKQFAQWPNLADYREIRKRTPKADWRAKRTRMLDTIRHAKQWWLVIDIHLDENDIVEALRIVREHRGTGRVLEVAKAAEADHPREAAGLYRRLAEHEIEARNRSAYQEACRHLKKVGELMTRTGQADEYRQYVAGLLESHRTLRAFREEVEKAKLLPEVPPTAVRRGGRK